ncbi:hypothetical protein [Actinomadura sp. 3N407]|uniref:hypothetical protein n=1 Tax=Actinomadura sp. 3N407 TaxID=3457423 RepID=UPI003FCC7101
MDTAPEGRAQYEMETLMKYRCPTPFHRIIAVGSALVGAQPLTGAGEEETS